MSFQAAGRDVDEPNLSNARGCVERHLPPPVALETAVADLHEQVDILGTGMLHEVVRGRASNDDDVRFGFAQIVQGDWHLNPYTLGAAK